MKKFIANLIIIMAGMLYASPIKIITTTSDFAALAREIGGSHVVVENLVPPKSDPHFMDPKPSFVVKLRQADILMVGGKALEDSWLSSLLKKSSNPNIQPGARGYFDGSIGVFILDIVENPDRSHGDIHASGNPHYLCYPQNALKVAQNFSAKLMEFKPEVKSEFTANYEAFAKLINPLLNEVSITPGAKIVSFHKSYEYLAKCIGAEIVGYMEPKPGIPPNPKHLASLIKTIEDAKASAIFIEPYQREKFAKFLKSKTGVPYYIEGLYPESNAAKYSTFLTQLIKRFTERSKGK